MSLRFEFDGQTLVEAIRATFDRRKMKLATIVPVALRMNSRPPRQHGGMHSSGGMVFPQRLEYSD
jgi:hypothetical protein